MLEIKNITKVYETEGFKQTALNKVSVNFRKCEFASILGPSGSGKTTFLNIIGGLDHYDSGDLIINETSTKKFKDSDWDSYRNHRVGFVFQSYNLITHQTVLSNVKLALTLSGISKKEAIDRAKEALKSVGLENHMYKRPNQLSGGQMQRVAIARALVNDPDILLADEPTGALDSETSVQIMELLKNIAKDKLVIMVTHNPDLAEEYSNRIINLKDGKIISDSNPYDGKVNTKEDLEIEKSKSKKTSMSFLTALSLSFNNLMTKKGRTILVSIAGSIGIIGIALIMAVSTGFQNYVDSIGEETLTSYPLTIMQESTDIASVLLSMRSGNGEKNNSNTVTEQQYMTNMLSSIKANDLKSFDTYLKQNYKEVENDLSTINRVYGVDPLIYTRDVTGKVTKLNPNNLFTSFYSSSMASSMSTYTSIYSQMMNNQSILNEQYDVLAGTWPSKYDEMVIVLSEPNSISDLLVYSLGLRDNEELKEMVTKIMSGESVEIKNTPKTFTYNDLLNVELKLILNPDIYKYNSKYKVYEDMSEDEDYLEDLYDKALKLKIVGIVSAKEGVNSMALSPGVAYRSELIDYIIDYSSKSSVVKEQLHKDEVDVFSGNRFDAKKNNFDFGFEDFVTVDNDKLQSAFNVKIDENQMKKETEGYMQEIMSAVTTDKTPANTLFTKNLKTFANEILDSSLGPISLSDVDTIVDNYLKKTGVKNVIKKMETEYVIPSSVLTNAYKGLLSGLLQAYIAGYSAMDPSLTTDPTNPIAVVVDAVKEPVINSFLENEIVIATSDTMATVMTEAVVKKNVLTKVGELTANLTNTFANAFDINPDAITSAFQLKFSEDELFRVVSAMTTNKQATLKLNLMTLGYQDKDEPTYISFYFNSFDSKEHFLKFLDSYNDKMKSEEKEDRVINYSDTTGILMDSVKTIVNAVSYVLIAFVSISLVVSSIMIGIITYISVYERTKEIGILRSIGASKHNISSIFNAETFIVGLLSGLFGIGISYTLIPIINAVLHHFTGNIPLSAALAYSSAIRLVILSIILTLIGGLIPARAASKKDPVEAVRSV